MTLDEKITIRYGKQTPEYMTLREAIISRFSYNPETGDLIRIYAHPNTPGLIGTAMKSKNAHGYYSTRIGGVGLLAHRIAFVFMTGELPNGFVDHINGDRSDNRWSNLRVCTKSENCRNLHGPRKNNSSGVLGVHWDKRFSKWKASIRADGKRYNLGSFDKKEDAVKSRIEASNRLHGDFSAHRVGSGQ